MKSKMPSEGGDAASAAKQADKLRRHGNICFKKGRLGAAIDAYTEAITLCPNVPIYWTNRALCHQKRNEWTRVEEDSRKAIHLDNSSFKAHYMLGLSLLQRRDYAGVRELEKAYELGKCSNPHSNVVEEIWQELANAKYLEWENISAKRSWDLHNLKEVSEAALREKCYLDHSQFEGFLDERKKSVSEDLETLGWVFDKATEDDKPTKVPDYLCCKITLDILRDPVITPSGVTYERVAILEYLQKDGCLDPLTRKPLDPSQLVPNLAMKEAVRAFLDKHGWAYKIG